MSTANMNLRTVAIGAVLSAIIAGHLINAFGWRQAALFAVGLGAGLVLYHAAFGFTSAWRKLTVHGDSSGVRAQVVMLGVTAAIFLPLLAGGEFLGTEMSPSNRPLGLSVIVGAFVFGVGMQLGGGCASGTLFTVGGGSVRMLATLAAFVAGSVLGALHRPSWEQAPGLEPFSLLGEFGLVGALSTTALLLIVVWVGSIRFEQSRNRDVRSIVSGTQSFSWFQGPWPLVAGAVGLAAVNIATLVLAGRPWGVTSGFALWGSKFVAILGVDVASWGYWQSPANAAALEGSVFANITSVMNFGIILGALIAAGLAGRYAPTWRVPARSLFAAVLGGILLGYGARIAYGCNIGAFFSGVSSSSLHGWLWLVAAFAGSEIGTRMRPWFGLAN